MGGKLPVRVVGVGGRQARTAPEYGHIYDHFALDYEYQNGVHVLSMCRQQPGTPGLVAEFAAGTKGRCDTQEASATRSRGRTRGSGRGEPTEPVRQEHTDLIASIRARQAAQRAAARRREHADGDHRPRGGLHRQGDRARAAARVTDST